MTTDLSAEDVKLVRLARAARLRAYTPHGAVPEGAAVRDTDGRTYAGATVDHADPALVTSALRVAVATAASSGARAFGSAVVVSDVTVAHDLDTSTVPVLVCSTTCTAPAVPKSVSLTLNIKDPKNLGAAYVVTLTGQRRQSS